MLDLVPGKVAVFRSGERCLIWPDESDDPQCFTGCLMKTIYDQADLSTLWKRSSVMKLDRPTTLEWSRFRWSSNADHFQSAPTPDFKGL